MNNSVLIVGGEGYIGSVLSSYLISKGFQVKSLDCLLYNNHSCVLNTPTNPNGCLGYSGQTQQHWNLDQYIAPLNANR